MIYELRIYHMHAGKMPAIHQRFSEVTLNLFRKHGMTVCDFWEDAEGNAKLYYILEHADRASRDTQFKAFENDPNWIQAKERSEEDGPIVEKLENYFMKRAPYSPLNH